MAARTDTRRAGALVALALAVAGAVVSAAYMLLPFTVPASGTTPELRCGPAPYELLVAADPAVPAPEDQGCDTPSRQRLLFGGAGLAVSLAVVIGVQRVGRERAEAADERWLRGSPRRRARGLKDPARA